MQSNMSHLTAKQLAEVLHGRLELGEMPPLDGPLTVVGRICTDPNEIHPGDVYWAVNEAKPRDCERIEEAFARGASGVVASGYRGLPWAGCWTVHVPHTNPTLLRSVVQDILNIPASEPSDETSASRLEPFQASIPLWQVNKLNGLTLLDWSKEATPDLWPQAMDSLHQMSGPARKWIICGDLCSKRWDDGTMHRGIGKDAFQLGACTGIIACGEFAREIATGALDAGLHFSRATACKRVSEVVDCTRRVLAPTDIVLIAGTRHICMSPVVESIEKWNTNQKKVA